MDNILLKQRFVTALIAQYQHIYPYELYPYPHYQHGVSQINGQVRNHLTLLRGPPASPSLLPHVLVRPNQEELQDLSLG